MEDKNEINLNFENDFTIEKVNINYLTYNIQFNENEKNQNLIFDNIQPSNYIFFNNQLLLKMKKMIIMII